MKDCFPCEVKLNYRQSDGNEALAQLVATAFAL